MKVSELTGALLDFEVGLAEGVLGLACTETECFGRKDAVSRLERYSPSTDWAQGGPIMEKHRITAWNQLCGGESAWGAETGNRNNWMWGRTALIAAMRCYVASKYGEEVPDNE